MTKLQLVQHVREILSAHCEDPVEAMIKQGKALVEIGEALRGKSTSEARAIMNAVNQLEDVSHPSL